MLALPVHALVRAIVGEELRGEPSAEVEVLVWTTSGPYQERRAPSGRFLPPDPRVREPHRLTPQLALRVAILGVVALAVFVVLFFRLWSLQVLSGDEYLNAAQSNQLRLIRVEAPRGPLLDRRGRVVVSNVAGTAVELWVGDMPERGPLRARAAARRRARRLAARARARRWRSAASIRSRRSS